MTDQPIAPVRRDLMPCIPPSDWEFFTAVATEDAVAVYRDELPGRAVVRRRVTYGDWEPVRPDRWAEESPAGPSGAVAPASAPEGAQEARGETGRQTDGAEAADGLREAIAAAIHRYDNLHALSGNDIPSKHHYGEADAALAVIAPIFARLKQQSSELARAALGLPAPEPIEEDAAEATDPDGDPDTRCGDPYRTEHHGVARCSRGLGHAGIHAGHADDGTTCQWPPPAPDSGPTIAEAADNDQVWDLQKGGE